MGGRSFAVDAVEAGYRLDGSEAEWFQRVLDAVAPELAHGFGTIAISYSFAGNRLVLDRIVGADCPGPLFAFTRGSYLSIPAEITGMIRNEAGDFYSFTEFMPRLSRELRAGYLAAFETLGMRDALVVSHPDGAGGWMAFTGLSDRRIRTVPRQRAAWRRACAHLATAWRLRRRLGRARSWVEAVVARGAPGAAAELWKGLLGGRWSLVSRAEVRGDRFLVAHRNQPQHSDDPRRLSPRERAVVELVLTGASNKRLAYALGLAPPTIASHLARALRKLGLADRMELLRLGGLAEETAPRLAIAGEELAALRLSAAREPSPELPLTPAEREIARLVGEGLSNGAIARRRGRSERTVANQIASIFDKLAIGSRAELALILARTRIG